jgi:hypothetical protein
MIEEEKGCLSTSYDTMKLMKLCEAITTSRALDRGSLSVAYLLGVVKE